MSCETRLAETAEKINVVRAAEVFGILYAKNNSHLARLLYAFQICGAIDAHEMIAGACNEAIPGAEELHRAVVSVWTTQTHGRMHDADSRLCVRLKIRGGKSLRILEPLVLFAEVESQDVEHIDHCRAANQIDCLPRVFRRRIGKETKATTVDHWRCRDCGGSKCRPLQHVAPGKLGFMLHVFLVCIFRFSFRPLCTNKGRDEIAGIDCFSERPTCFLSPSQSCFRASLLQGVDVSRNLDTCVVVAQACREIVSLRRIVRLNLDQRIRELRTLFLH